MLSENIRVMRRRRGLSQGELAERIHVVRQTVSKWEKNLSVPDAAVLIDLAGALDTTVGALLGETVSEQEMPGESDAVRELSDRLEALNAQLARQSERRRKGWRIAFLAVVIIVLVSLGLEGAMALMGQRLADTMDATVGIIGGADGPTSIVVSSIQMRGYGLIARGVLGLAAAFGLWRTRRR